MRIVSFRIKNFRSIIDSNWNNLAYDNITALIGQNESGKTSVMEALVSFYNGEISENVLRSDLSMPEISCCFNFDEKLIEIIDRSLIPEDFFPTLKKKGKFTLTRKWISEKHNKFYLSDVEIKNIYRKAKNERQEKENKIKSAITNTIEQFDRAVNELANLNIEKQDLEKKHKKERSEFVKLEASFKKNPNDKELKILFEETRENIGKQQIKLDKLIESCNNLSKKTSALNENATHARICINLDKTIAKITEAIDLAESEIKTSVEQREFASSWKKRRTLQKKLDTLNRIVANNRLELDNTKKELSLKYQIIGKIFEGKTIKEAEQEAIKLENREKSYLQLDEIGELLHQYIPEFEFFEDFSSLLPDRIDLEDIVNQNTQVQGYKAANNFLSISGLTSDFFNHKNNRILKQKIENLNGEINIDFHEYWQQKIGKENKIKINFELEHYDFQNPEKKGKPYLEFWIKDDKERLYPKQRSRGVRWFLSFYLELKAKALSNKNKNIVLLIDEPGVSLHARAQEDVLKVFEDIKDNVQIIYTTHSPHLINVNKLYRLLAVQRAKEDDDYSESVIFDTESLNTASTDTLSPIYSLMGTRISEQQVIQKKNNVIVEDVTTYYYLTTFLKLSGIKTEIHLLPSTDVHHITTLVNILLGWKVDYIVLLDDDKDGNMVFNELKKQLFRNDDEKAGKKMLLLDNCKSIEDLFSTIDFKKYILQKREGITESNSEYIDDHKLSRPVLASSFLNYVEKNNVSINDFDEETKNNIELTVNRIINALS